VAAKAGVAKPLGPGRRASRPFNLVATRCALGHAWCELMIAGTTALARDQAGGAFVLVALQQSLQLALTQAPRAARPGSASRIVIVFVAVAAVAIAAPRIQKLDRDNDATFLFGQSTTLPISQYPREFHNDDYVKLNIDIQI
jgi:hypothetical protein